MANSETHLYLKIFVDKEKNRVLFAEADSDFVDILFSFLTLPLGTIVRLIGNTQSDPATVGCFTTLYQSVMSLGDQHFCSNQSRDTLRHPRSSSEAHCRRLIINIDDTEAKILGEKAKNTREMSPKGEVFFAKDSKFIITDDLQVTPVLPRAVLGILINLGITDMNVIEERTVNLGSEEVLELLKWTLNSTTPLTYLFISKEKLPCSPVPKKQSVTQKGHCVGNKKINVKVVLNKSNNRLLFVEADKDFMDLLFSFLVVPLGEMLHTMEGQSCLGCIDGLYKSAQSLDSHYFISPDHKNILLRPKLPPLFPANDDLFPLESLSRVRFMGEDTMLFVFDNLEVAPYSLSSAISVYKRFEVPVSDLEERTLSIGVAEGINIVRASLNWTSSALSIGLHDSLNFKEPKQEK